MTIENINIIEQYDGCCTGDDVHYETFARLAEFFGRNMRPHWHDRYYQMHFLATGRIALQQDDHFYAVQAPLFVLTPPSVPHAFYTGPESDGHVLTIRQEVLWPLFEELWPGSPEASGMQGFCLSLAQSPETLAALDHYWPLVAGEFRQRQPGRQSALTGLARNIISLLLRVADPDGAGTGAMRGELKVFQRFNRLVDEHFAEHLTVPDYARTLGISESRLNELCRRFANQSTKRLIHERVLREARRLLMFSAHSVNQIAWDLGYKDPAYFARVFNRMEGCSPSQYRQR
ncbi:4-hydroxyphenylacetate catabolism regulatory protein HpaA [Salmonella enterica subsp. enterica serovar Choleraesuis]|nr:4-hydroxyphenylacetate catabolism regulatory protein HpaA [Salmonella enterica subsp. enterica serovar Choleraesuis]